MTKTLEEIIGYIEEEDLEKEVEAFYKWQEAQKRVKREEKGERGAIHINLISQTEMKAHTKEMREEMDRKFVRCLMVTGLDTREAIRRVKVWNAEWGSEKHGN